MHVGDVVPGRRGKDESDRQRRHDHRDDDCGDQATAKSTFDQRHGALSWQAGAVSLRPEIPLQDGEGVVVDRGRPLSASWAPLIFSLGLYEFARRCKRFVVTDRRVIILDGLPGSREVTALPLGWVQDVTVLQQFWLGQVLLSTAGGKPGTVTVGWLTISQAREFAQAVSERPRGDIAP